MLYDLTQIYEVGKELIAQGRLAEAMEVCREILEDDQHCPQGHYLMSQIYLRKNEYASALDYADNATRYGPNIAEFQMQCGRVLLAMGHLHAAEQAYRKTLAINPHYHNALGDLFNVLVAQQSYQNALPVLRQLIALNPRDMCLMHMLASLEGKTTVAAPLEFVSSLFDEAAPAFDFHMSRDLHYNTPSLIAGAIGRVAPGINGLSMLDLGCGTGLVAEALQEITVKRIGVDISGGMLEKAQEKLMYNELYQREMVDFMMASAMVYDLAVAADALVYTGYLTPFFTAAKRVVAPQGLLVFTFEKEAGIEAYRLNVTGRYSHHPSYIEEELRNCGFEIVLFEDASLRSEDHHPVEGMLCLATHIRE